MSANPSYADLVEAIADKCRDCSGGTSGAKGCTMKNCPLFTVRPWYYERPTKAQRRRDGQQMRIRIARGGAVVIVE